VVQFLHSLSALACRQRGSECEINPLGTGPGAVAGLSRRNPQLPLAAEYARQAGDQENSMLDIVMLALGLGFFVAAVGYTYACERL
jgi:hypothetical protein